MPTIPLRSLLVLDSAACATMGALLLLAPGPVGTLTALPPDLLTGAGLVLLPVAAFMLIASRLQPVPHWASAVVIGGNALWVAASLALPLSGAVEPNGLGWALLTAQAVVVAMLAWMEAEAAGAEKRFA